jgi:hypothetical protein
MFVEITTGKDSFRRTPDGIHPARNARILSFVRVDKKVIPLFVAYKDKLKGFKETKIVESIPATTMFSEFTPGTWFRNRCEVLSGTEILIDYNRRDSNRTFGTRSSHLLLVVDPEAPLYSIRLPLPTHPYSSVPNVFFEGRFRVIDQTATDTLSDVANDVWLKYLGVDTSDEDGLWVGDVLDPSEDDPAFIFNILEKASRSGNSKAAVVMDNRTGKSRVKIRRTRKVRI